MDMTAETITHHQLCDQGLSDHQAGMLTQYLCPVSIEQGIHFYRLRDVITAVRHQLASAPLPPEQRKTLHEVLASLLQQLDNVVVAPFGLSRDQQIGFHIQNILHTQASFLQPTSLSAEPANVVLLPGRYQQEAIPE